MSYPDGHFKKEYQSNTSKLSNSEFVLKLNIQRLPRLAPDVVQSGCPIFDDFFQHLWPYIGNNTANVVFQMVKSLWLIRIDQ
ncbi:hypothetical protein TNCV_4467671 [Trichonephila clavipes]|nr:hypothetical protein TNCV_4467671 [Trichonephila clavipes]